MHESISSKPFKTPKPPPHARPTRPIGPAKPPHAPHTPSHDPPVRSGQLAIARPRPAVLGANAISTGPHSLKKQRPYCARFRPAGASTRMRVQTRLPRRARFPFVHDLMVSTIWSSFSDSACGGAWQLSPPARRAHCGASASPCLRTVLFKLPM
jgi:hypothetical protein